MAKRPVYLDNHATTRTDPRVVEAMLPYFTERYGNASSVAHRFGWEADEAVEKARSQVARLINAEPREVIFTSGATEANNLAIKGVASGYRGDRRHLVTVASEHRAVLDPMKRLAHEGYDLTILRPAPTGLVTAEMVGLTLTDQTLLVSVMMASNEVGTINEVAEIGRLCRDNEVHFHTDATQAVGKVPVDVKALEVDLLSLSGHKFHGPKGVGCLYVSREDSPVRLSPLFDGGGQERNLRSGTVPVPLVVGLGEAAEIALVEMEAEAVRVGALRDRLWERLSARLGGLRRNGHPTRILPGNLSVSFEGVDGEALMLALRDVAVSSGAACSTTNSGPSHVLTALGIEESLARATLRFGLGRFTTEEDVDFVADYVMSAVGRLRTAQP